MNRKKCSLLAGIMIIIMAICSDGSAYAAGTSSASAVNFCTLQGTVAEPDSRLSDLTYASSDEIPDGYIEMPWDSDAPAVDPEMTIEEAEAMIAGNDEDSLHLTGSSSEDVPGAWPECGYTDQAGLKTYVNTYLMPLKNQNPYGTCWAFTATGLMESSMLFNHLPDLNGEVDRSVDYSELQLAYFYYHNNINPITGDNGGDEITTYLSGDHPDFLDYGGNIGLTARTLINWLGSVSENVVPYSTAGTVISTDNGKKAVSGIDEKYARDADIVHLKNAYHLNIQKNPDLVKQYILKDGMVGASFYARQSYYDSGNNSYYVDGYSSPNHAVCIVGWDDDFPAENFSRTPEANGAWLIRNSWKSIISEQFSYYGYFWMSYCDKSLDSTVYAFEAESSDDYDNNYFYTNQLHLTSSWSFNKQANVFTVGGTSGDDYETLEAVAVDVRKGADYTISICETDSDGKPTDKKLVEDTTGTFPYEGIYTVLLKESVTLERGTSFAVVVEADGQVGVECSIYSAGVYSTTVNANSGESFYYSGSSWSDLSDRETGSNKNYGNFCINALTVNSGFKQTASNFDFSAPVGSYTGSPYKAEVTPKAEIAGGEVTVYYRSRSGSQWTTTPPVNIGTYQVAVDYPAVGKYFAASKLTDESWTLTITRQKSLKDTVVTVRGVEDQKYTGFPVLQADMKVYYDGTLLEEGTDYSVSYRNNINPGINTAVITLEGMGQYTGERELRFSITGPSMPELTIKSASPITYGQALSESVISFSASFNGADVPGSCVFSRPDLKPSVLNSGTTVYDVIFIPKDPSEYSKAYGSITVTVNPADVLLSGLKAASIVSGQKLRESAISGMSVSSVDSSPVDGRFLFTDEDIVPKLTDSGITEYAVEFSPNDGLNFRTAKGVVTVMVEPEENIPVTVVNGRAYVDGNEIQEAPEGTVVTIKASIPLSTRFSGWDIRNASPADNTETTTVTVGSHPVTATAYLEDDPEYVNESIPEKTEPEGAKIKSLSIRNASGEKVSSLMLAKGEQVLLKPEVVMALGNPPETVFRSSDSEVLRINSAGQAVAWGEGTALITLYSGNKTTKCSVTVTEEVSAIKITSDRDQILVGEQVVLSTNILPSGSSADMKASWTVDDKSKASISGGFYGAVLTAKKAGNVNVVLKVKTRDKSGKPKEVLGTATIMIKEATVPANRSDDRSYKLSFKKSSITMNLADGFAETQALLSKAEKSGQVTLSWSSSNENVVVIRSARNTAVPDGKKAVASVVLNSRSIGSAYVTVTATDNVTGVSNVSSVKVTVTNPIYKIQVTGDGLSKLDNNTITLRKGQCDRIYLKYTDSPSNINKISFSASGGVSVKSGVICAKKVTSSKPAKVTVKCGSARAEVYVVVTE